MRRRLLVAGLVLAFAGPARGDQTLQTNLNAAGFRVYNPHAPTLGTDVLRLQDVTPGNCILQSTAINGAIICASITGFSATAPLVLTGSVLSLGIDSSLAVSGGTLQRGALTGAITAAAGSGVTAFGSMAGLSVLGRSAGSSGVPAAITSTTSGDALWNNAGTLTWGPYPYAALTGAPAGLPPTGAAGGDLGSTYPNPTVIAGEWSGTRLTFGALADGAVPVRSGTSLVALTLDPTLLLSAGTLSRPAITGDVGIAAGGNTSVLLNIPNDTPQAGDLLATGIAAPASPTSGKGRVYFDSTSLNLAVKNASGTVNHGAQTFACSASQWARALGDSGATTCTQPAFSDISGAPPAITSLTTDVVATGPGAAAATIQPNVVTNAKAAQMVASTIKGNATNATANAQDVAATAASQVPLSTTTGWGWSALDSSTSGGVASWIGTRYFAADAGAGNDANVGYSDVSQAAAGAVAVKTLKRLMQIIPKNGAGQNARAAIKAGSYSSDATWDISGFSGYNELIFVGTDTVASAGATAFAGDANDATAAGMTTATGMNTAGYNVTAYSVDADGTPHVTLQLNGGGSPGFGAMPARPYRSRIRFSSSTTTAALRNKGYGIMFVSGGNQIITANALAATPVVGDVAYIEMPGVSGPTQTFISGGNATGIEPGIVLVGLSLGQVRADRASVQFTGCEATTVGAVLSNINTTALWIDTTFATPLIGMGLSFTTWNSVGGQLQITEAANSNTSAWVIQQPVLLRMERATSGAQLIVYGGDHALGNDIVETIGTNSSTAHGATMQIWGTVAAPQGTARSGLYLSSGAQIGRIKFSNMGANPGIAVGGSGMGIHLQNPSGGVADGNTGVGLDVTASVGNSDGAAGCDIKIVGTPTVTGSGGDIKLPDGTIVTWAQANAGLLDSKGNRWVGSTSDFPAQVTTAGVLLTPLAGTGTRYAKASSTGLLSAASATIPSTDITGLAPIATSGSAADLTTGVIPCARLAALTGDVTSLACATTIASHAVSSAKFRQSTANTLVGNATGGTADVTDITLGAGCSFSGGTLTCPGTGITSLTGDVTGTGPGATAATVVNLPNGVTQAGRLLATAIAAPATPAAGKGAVYVDSTSKNIAVKDDAGLVKHGVQTVTATASQWIRAIADDGSATKSQPAFSDLSGSATCANLPALTGDLTTTAGTCATAITANAVTNGDIRQSAGMSVLGRSAGTTGNVSDITATGNGQCLQTVGGAAVWAACPSSGGGGTVTAVTASGALSSSGGTAPNITLNANGVTDSFLRQGAATSVIGRSANSIGNEADIACTADGNVLWRSGTTLGCSLLDYSKLTSLPVWPATNDILVSSGTGTTPTGTANFTYNTSTNLLTLAASDVSNNSVRLTRAATQQIEKGGTGGLRIGVDHIDTFALYTNTADRLVIDGNGNLKLNAYGAGHLQTDASGNVTTNAWPASTQVLVSAGTGAAPVGDATFSHNTSTHETSVHNLAVSSTDGSTHAIRLDATGNVSIAKAGASGDLFIDNTASGAIHLDTGGLQRLSISAGGSINFGAYGRGTLVTDASGNVSARSAPAMQLPYFGDLNGTISGIQWLPTSHSNPLGSWPVPGPEYRVPFIVSAVDLLVYNISAAAASTCTQTLTVTRNGTAIFGATINLTGNAGTGAYTTLNAATGSASSSDTYGLQWTNTNPDCGSAGLVFTATINLYP